MTEEEEETVFTEEDDSFLTEDDEVIFWLELDSTFLLELDVLDPFDSTDVPLRVTLLEDESSSFADVPLSSPQAMRAMDKKRASRDCFATLAMTFRHRLQRLHPLLLSRPQAQVKKLSLALVKRFLHLRV